MVSITSIQRRPLAAKRKAFTLAEVMIATVIFVVSMLAILSTIIAAYRVTMVSRYQDRAFNALRTIADQFQNAPTNDKNPPAIDTSDTSDTVLPEVGTKRLFWTTKAPTGSGMAWDTVSQAFVFPSDDFNPAKVNAGLVGDSLSVPLGTVSSTLAPVTAKLTRFVEDKTPPVASGASAVGNFRRGTFTIQYTYLKRTVTLRVVVLRNLNPSDIK